MKENSFELSPSMKRYTLALAELSDTIQVYEHHVEQVSKSRNESRSQLDASNTRIQNLIHSNLSAESDRFKEISAQLEQELIRFQNLLATVKVKQEYQTAFSNVLAKLREAQKAYFN